MTDVAVILGTRPEVVKLAPVVLALRARGLRVRVLATGQHSSLLDAELLGALGEVEALGIASDDSVVRFLASARDALRGALDGERPRAILVQGDTMSAFAGASIAKSLGIPVAHVEAGIRSGDLQNPWPEESIRCEIDRWATWRYAATTHAGATLAREGLGVTMVTGNTGVDALKLMGVGPREDDNGTVLVTLHRREFRQRADARDLVETLFRAIAQTTVPWVWPVHPGMHGTVMGLDVPGNLSLRPPFGYRAMLNALAGARGVLTDSGGLVEEAATLGIPTVIWRDANDRPEAVDAKIAQAIPVQAEAIPIAVEALTSGRVAARRATCVYGDGAASIRIAQHLAEALGNA